MRVRKIANSRLDRPLARPAPGKILHGGSSSCYMLTGRRGNGFQEIRSALRAIRNSVLWRLGLRRCHPKLRIDNSLTSHDQFQGL